MSFVPERRKHLSEEQRTELAKLDVKILKAFPASPKQRELKKQRSRLEIEYGVDPKEAVRWI